MLSLIYVSSSVQPFTQTQLLALLENARQYNVRHGVTGMLLYKREKFMQVIEGEDEVVDHLFDTIRRDPRHCDVITLLKHPIHERQFAGWSMGFRDLQDPGVGLAPGYDEFLGVPLTSEEFSPVPSRAQKLLLTFKQNGERAS